MRNTSRFEIKYRISMNQYIGFKNAVIPYLEKDDFTLAGDSAGYIVRSLYFDTFDLKAYREKEEGDFGRIKLRLRTYSDDRENPGPVSVEIKTKSGTYMEKFSTFVDFCEYEYFMKTYHWKEHDNAVTAEFERLVHIRTLRPVVLVQYNREGFIPRDRDDFRITIDRYMKVSGAKELFPRSMILKKYYPENIVLEIKCSGNRPEWLLKIVRDLDLKVVANSKYAQAVETINRSLK